MEEQKLIKITTRKQFEEIVSFMTKNASIAKGQKLSETCSKCAYEVKWQELSAKLNSFGPPIRNTVGWQKVWNDYKLKIRKKLSHNKKELNSTGGGPFRLAHLNTREEQVSNLLSLHRVALCDAPTYSVHNEDEEQLFESFIERDEVENTSPAKEDLIEIPEYQQPSPKPRRKRKRQAQQEDYKKRMLDEQTKAMREIPKLLDKTNKYLKNISSTLDKKYELYKKMQRKKEAEIELRMEIMDLKKKKNAIRNNKNVNLF